MTTVGAALALLDVWYDQAWAEPWDTVGLVSGDPGAELRAVHVAVDPTETVAAEAVAAGAQLLLTHHPLWLGGTATLAPVDAKGRTLGILVRGGCALQVAHTNADVAAPGVSDALGDVLGLAGMRPVQTQADRLDRWVVYVPATHTAAVLDAMAAAGAGSLGDYERCAFVGAGTGTFRPLPGAQPHTGTVGVVERVSEERLDMVAAPSRRDAIAAAMRTAHPYQQPSCTVVDALAPSARGLGRVGTLTTSMALHEFCRHVARSLPLTVSGVRATGDPAAMIKTVAVSGGACLDLAGLAAAAGADVLVTSDAKHHRAQEAPLPVVDVAHWAGEWPWTVVVAERLRTALPGITVTVSQTVSDPWTMRASRDGVGTLL